MTEVLPVPLGRSAEERPNPLAPPLWGLWGDHERFTPVHSTPLLAKA